MPIYGLTDRGLSFAQIGVIRKGAPKDPGGNRPGKDLEYFRVVFDDAEQDSAKRFAEVYGPQPKLINVIFPFNDVDQIAQFWLEAYTAGRMVARSDGRIYTYKVDTKTGELVVRNGLNIKTGQPEPYNPDEPAGYYKNNKGVEEAIWCKGVGRIRVVVPELKRFAYLLLMTTSLHDIANLSEQLAGIYESNHHRIAGVPFILQRKPRKVSCPDPSDKTKRARRTKWLLSIEPNPLWVESKLLSMGKEALMLDPGQQRMMALPSGMPKQNPQAGPEPVIEADWTNVAPAEDFNDDDGYEDEFVEPETLTERDPDPVINPAQPALPPLRCQPDQLKLRIAATAKANTEALTNGKKGTVAGVLESCLSQNIDPKAARKQLLVYLIGKDSLNDASDNEVMALYRWLAPSKNEVSGEWFADAMSAREAVAAFNACQPEQTGLF
jgi:hypothetical protein